MNDIDTLLSVIENPTRRKILMALVREPHYPLQLSRELGISQQAVMKNLDIMEKSGLVESWRESSDKGPEKIVYRPTFEFTLTIDLRNGMFRATLSRPDDFDTEQENIEAELEEMRESLFAIDKQIDEFDRMREEMIRRRNVMIRSFMSGPIAGELDYIERAFLYEMLNSPGHDIEEVSGHMGVREDRMTEIMNEIECKCKDAKGGMKNE
jgi:predicted transcriptional regulator